MRTHSMMGHTGRQLLAGSPLCPVILMFNWGPSVHPPCSPGSSTERRLGSVEVEVPGRDAMSRALGNKWCVFFQREKGARRGRGPGAEERASAEAGRVGGLTSASRQVHLQVGLAGPRGRGRVPPPRLLLGRLLHLLVVVIPGGSRAGVRDGRAGRGWGKGGGVGRYRAS